MGTDRLYYRDSYLTAFDARVTRFSGGGRLVYLDRTAFYPASGGQPADRGSINGVAVVDVTDEGDEIAHTLASPVAETAVECRVDWARRFGHMQQHTGQHLLSAVLVDLFGYPTVGFHLGEESSTIDIGAPALDARQVDAVMTRANAIVHENRPVAVTFEDAAEAGGLRKPSEREGCLRVVSIEGYDRSACGGTHVRATGEIGAILIRKLDRIRGNVRIEFLCGMRAVRRAAADYRALSEIGRLFSAPVDDTPGLLAAHLEAARAAEKARSRLASELARLQGKELYEATAPGPGGLRRHIERRASGSIDDELRMMAQGFTAGPDAHFLAVIEEPPAVLLAVSSGSATHAGNALKAALSKSGGRGGGNAQLAQGSVPSRELLDAVLAELGATALP